MKINATGLGDVGKIITLLGFALFIWSAGWVAAVALFLMWVGRTIYECRHEIIMQAASRDAATKKEQRK